MTIEDLIGTWDLVFLFGKSTEVETWQIYGENPAGMPIYTAESTMSTVLMKHGRSQFTGGLDAPTSEELEKAFFGFDAYCGTFTLDLNENKVTHHVLASRLPMWVGSDQVRYYELEGDTLTISSAPMTVRGTDWVIYVVWNRH